MDQNVLFTLDVFVLLNYTLGISGIVLTESRQNKGFNNNQGVVTNQSEQLTAVHLAVPETNGTATHLCISSVSTPPHKTHFVVFKGSDS